LIASYFVSTPAENINWVCGLDSSPQTFLPPAAYLCVLMVTIPIVVYIPTHFALRRFYKYGGEQAKNLPS
jgi:hypothetical protein